MKKEKKKSEFEFCKVCKFNNDQGPRHKFFPNHKKSLSSFLSRFRNKLSDVRSSLNSPTPPNPQSRTRFWCDFCDQDILDLSSSFACANAIRHLASADHVKNLKHFFWKYGASSDQLDAFMFSDDVVAKWEKRCVARKNDAVLPSEGSPGAVFIGPSSDIHNQPNNGNINTFENVNSQSVYSYPSNAVFPLPCYTNEYYQVSCSGLSGVGNGNIGPLGFHTTSLPLEACSSANPFALQESSVEMGSHALPYNGRQWASAAFTINNGVHENGKTVSTESSHQGLQMLTRISSMPSENSGGNVHAGAPPPWFEAAEGVQVHSKPALGDRVSQSDKSGKSKKLNPKRVGAAWAEKRKVEMEMEKRGETVKNEFDANWLPNFGRVWQSGSRRESRKEFEREKRNINDETQSEMPIKIQPYVSKRMRMDSGGDCASR